MKKVQTLFAALLLLFAAVVPAAAADAPEISISSASAQVGETVTVTISMKHVADFTSGDINLQFNPNILKLTAVTKSSAMEADRDISMMYTDPQNEEDYQNAESYTFNLALFHLYQFPQSLDSCDVVSLTFEAIGVGECPLVLGAMSFQISEAEVSPVLNGGMVTVSGGSENAEPAESWDYAAHVDENNMYTDASYTFAIPTVETENGIAAADSSSSASSADGSSDVASESGMSTGAKVGIAVAVVVAVAAVVVIVIAVRKKNEMIDG